MGRLKAFAGQPGKYLDIAEERGKYPGIAQEGGFQLFFDPLRDSILWVGITTPLD